MCGIIGGIGKGTKWNLQKALNHLISRGPDAVGIYQKNNHYLGHRRLSIVGITKGKQPITNEDGNIKAVINGEFYNYLQIKQKLIGLGHKFKTESDSEILIHLYEEYQEEAINYLRGEFAFILLDIKANKLWAGRDRLGARPLYWTRQGTNISLASHPNAIASLLKLPLTLDEQTLGFSSQFQYLPTGATWFKDINLIPPAHTLTIQNGKIKVSRYWRIPKETGKATNYSKHLRAKVEEAVRIRIPQEVKACTHLSGGLDSSIITTIASEYGVKDAFTVSFPNSSYNELVLAETTAKKLGINLIEVPITIEDVVKNFAEVVLRSQDVFINGHGVAKYILSQKINGAGFKVALTGEGSDEIFYGYSHLIKDYLGKKRSNHTVVGIHTPRHEVRIPSMKDLEFIPTWIKAKYELGQHLRALLHLPEEHKDIVRVLTTLQGLNRVEISAQSWAHYCLSGYILRTLDDAMGMAHAVESRLPFLDHKLIAWVRGNILLAEHFKSGEKRALRSAFKADLHPKVLRRKKQPFMAPSIQLGLKDHWELIAEPILQSGLPLKNGVRAWLETRRREAVAGKTTPHHEPILCTLLSLSYIGL